jgi:L-asparaginase/Glu-tRNA(Gln) amidotransferase subunit D
MLLLLPVPYRGSFTYTVIGEARPPLAGNEVGRRGGERVYSFPRASRMSFLRRLETPWAAVSAVLLAPAIACVAPCPAQEAHTSRDLPLVWVLSTGSTISGKGASSTSLTEDKSDSFRGEEIVKEVPEIQLYANLKVGQIVNVSSADITLDNWITLANRINRILAEATKAAGIEITHGTNTIEETSYFLNLTIKHDRSVVLAGAAMERMSVMGLCRRSDV